MNFLQVFGAEQRSGQQVVQLDDFPGESIVDEVFRLPKCNKTNKGAQTLHWNCVS